jgi:hypothetical protein
MSKDRNLLEPEPEPEPELLLERMKRAEELLRHDLKLLSATGTNVATLQQALIMMLRELLILSKVEESLASWLRRQADRVEEAEERLAKGAASKTAH